MAVSILDVQNITDKDTNPLDPELGGNDSGTGNRFWVLCQMSDGGANSPATMTISGTTDTTMTLLDSDTTTTPHWGLWYCKDADFGTAPSTSNGGITAGNFGSVSTQTWCVLFDGVDQTTPFDAVQTQGWDTGREATSETAPFTLDETADGAGVAFFYGKRDLANATITLAGGYAHDGNSPVARTTNDWMACATDLITTTSLGQLRTFNCSSTEAEVIAVAAMMLLPVSAGGSIIKPVMHYNRMRLG